MDTTCRSICARTPFIFYFISISGSGGQQHLEPVRYSRESLTPRAAARRRPSAAFRTRTHDSRSLLLLLPSHFFFSFSDHEFERVFVILTRKKCPNPYISSMRVYVRVACVKE